MEVAGVVFGALALVGVFEDCVTLLSQIGAAKSRESDYMRLETKFDFQKTLLLQWANRLNLFDPENYDDRLDDAVVGPIVKRGLECIRQLLEDGHSLQRRYGVRAVQKDEETVSSSVVSSRLMSRFREKSQKLRLWREAQLPQSTNSTLSYDLPGTKDNKGLSTFAKITWVIKDKDQFESLIRDISDLINDMDRVVPPQRNDDLASSVLKNEIQKLRNVRDLTKILDASTDDDNDLADITKETIDRECTRLILGRLWFRLIDDRKDSIAEAHSKTFDWALHAPTSENTWSDLGQWLRSGRGIYWISGKPGSGKSTLMKFLYNHPEVAKALEDWSGNRKLTVASFFLWNLGTLEQNSQQGLAQGLLHRVLNQNQSLIPVILPQMWTEAQNGSVRLEIPSSVEMQRAFQRLGTESTNGAYVFFIDGLDEFTGNHRDGISFVQSFACSANIKILLSSRPIDTCVAAFSTKPKLRLQDLTESDMDSYVNDIVRTHPYVADSPYLSEAVVDRLIDDLRSKADGVFLWVVLACRTLLEGFDAYDNAKELQRRVDELPPELSDLFRHILSGLPARSLQQTAKLLKVCYTSRLLQISGRISTLALAWADEKDLSTTTFADFTRYSEVEMRAKCKNLDGRLRSRCRGLLEVHHQRDKHSWTEPEGAETSSVDFMHRTVFEFLSTPRVWEMDCLQIHDSEFDASTILSSMSNYLLYLQKVPVRQKVELAVKSLAWVRHIHRTSPSQDPRSLHQLALALMEPRHESMDNSDLDSPELDSFDDFHIKIECHDDPGEKEEEYFFAYSQANLPLSHAALLLAVETNLTGYIKEEDVRAFHVSQKQPGSRYKGTSLLYHAINKPLLASIQIMGRLLPTTVATLIQFGCDPNESIFGDSPTTPWKTWTRSRYMQANSVRWALTAAEVTLLMIRGGAILKSSYQNGLSADTVTDWRSELVSSAGRWLDLLATSNLGWSSDTERNRLEECCSEIIQAVGASR